MPHPCSATLEADADQRGELDYDAQLLQRIAGGDRIALGELYCRASASLHTVAIGVLSDPSEAEDVIQDVFVVIWNRASLFEMAHGNASRWLAAITRRRAIDRWRVRTRNAMVPDTLGAEHESRIDDEAGSWAEFSLRDEDDRRVVRCAVVALPTAMRQLIELLFFRGLSHAEAAKELREPLGTVKARARRALLRLKTLLRHAGFEDIERMNERRVRGLSSFET